MNVRTALDILGFPSRNKKQAEQRNKTHPKCGLKYVPPTRSSKSRSKKGSRYFQRRGQHLQQLPIPESMAAQLNAWPEDTCKQHKKLPQEYLNHPITERRNPLFIQRRSTKSMRYQKDHKKFEESVQWPRISQTQHEIKQSKQQIPKKNEIIIHNGRHVFRRPIVKSQILQRHANKSSAQVVKVQKYYISDLKNSILQYINNRDYVSPYISHLMDSISAFQVSMHVGIPKVPPKLFQLPVSKGKITIIFDLDETLVHTQVVNECSSVNSGDWGSIIEICTENGDYFVNLKIRPHAVEVLCRLSDKFQLGVFTASQQSYGEAVLNVLDPEQKFFSFKLFRQHCFEVHSRINHVKDLRILRNRDISKMILIDNSAQAYLFQKCNAVPIIPFFSDAEDTELLKLENFLNTMSEVEDVRPILKDYFKFEQYHNYRNMLKLVRQLY